MTEPADHPYEAGPFGRCVTCNRHKKAHEAETPAEPGPGVAEVEKLQRAMKPNSGRPVVVRQKLGMGKGGEDHEMRWPLDWRLPQIGESIQAEKVSGRVTDVRFDLDHDRIIISVG